MELGSEFHIDLTSIYCRKNTIYELLKDYHTFYVDYGRTGIALFYQAMQKKQQEKKIPVLLPSYICKSVIDAFPMECITFYELDENFVLEEGKLTELIKSEKFENGIFYLNHYFDMVQPKTMLKRLELLCKQHNITILEDTTHSLFSCTRTIGDYCIASLRKWMPLTEGAVVYSERELPAEWQLLEPIHPSAKIDAMILKKMFLGDNSVSELVNQEMINKTYRDIFVAEEENADKENVYAISDLSAFLLQCQDVLDIKSARMRNYAFLKEYLYEKGISLYRREEDTKEDIWVENTTPYTALLKLQKQQRDDFRHYMVEHKIYCAIHWPIETGAQYNYPHISEWADGLISLPIDQRYGSEEMKYLADTILAYYR